MGYRPRAEGPRYSHHPDPISMMQRATICCMTRSVRIKEHLAAELERLAKEERRSLANLVEVLLEQALTIESGERGFVREMPATNEPLIEVTDLPDVKATVRVIPREEADPHFKPDFKK